MELLPPIYPGEILKEEFLEPMGISQYRLAKEISVKHAYKQAFDVPNAACKNLNNVMVSQPVIF